MSKKPSYDPDLPGDWSDFLSLLISARVKFLIVGGHAVAVHGSPRYTQDLDLFVEPTLANATKLRRVLVKFGFADGSLPAAEAFTKSDKVFMIGRVPLRIDLLTGISGIDFATAWSARYEIETSAGRVAVVSRAHLLQNKRAAGRPKDLADVALLEATAPSAPKRSPRRPKPRAR